MKLTIKQFMVFVLALGVLFIGYDKIKTNEALAKMPNGPVSVPMAEKALEKPVAPEINPPGDIPDSQVFVSYASRKGGYELDVPEGWARTGQDGDVVFTSKLDGLSVTITETKSKPDLQSVSQDQVERLRKTDRAVTIKSIGNSRRKNSVAVRMVYESNSEPNPVTNKQVRLENNTYIYYRNSKAAELRLWAPVGADNIDQWNRISNSFRWR